jgi:hypothetical protein
LEAACERKIFIAGRVENCSTIFICKGFAFIMVPSIVESSVFGEVVEEPRLVVVGIFV